VDTGIYKKLSPAENPENYGKRKLNVEVQDK
jgi:hypothetical protein